MPLNTILGGGSWGTTVASVVSRNAPTVLSARDEAFGKHDPIDARRAFN